jgi:membrane protein implicated in regulation of membrane protease activity
MNKLQMIFTVCALIGGALFLIRLAMQLLGFETDAETDHPGDMDSSDTDASFKMLSLLGITAFLMMFGLGGRAMLESRPGSPLAALVIAVLAGSLSMWLMAWLFKLMKKMQSDGTSRIENAVGQEGSVYLTIPAQDIGKVQLSVNGRLSVMDARAANGQPLATGAQVKVVRILNGNILEVESV